MMKNNNSYDLSESDEFYSLLHEFVEAGEARQWQSASGLYKGLAYALPAIGGAGTYVRVKGIRLTFGTRVVELGGETPSLFMPAAGGRHPSLRLDIDTVLSATEVYESLQAVFHIYREGRPEPVASAEWEGDEYGGIHLDFPTEGDGFLPGNYFLLGERVREDGDDPQMPTLNSHLCLPFRLLPAGEGLEHPQVVTARACRPARLLEAGGYTSGLLRLTLRLDRPVPGRCEFAASCYTAEWNPMAGSLRYVSHGRGRQLTFCFHAAQIWMPGEYFAVVSQNGEPFVVVNFRYDGQETIVGRCRRLSETDGEYWMVKHLEPNAKSRWRMVQSCPGLGAAKPRLVQMARLGHFNSLCERLGLEALKGSLFRVVISDEPFPAKKLAYALPTLAGFGTPASKLVDCAEWVATPGAAEDALKNRAGQAIALHGLSALLQEAARPVLDRLADAVADRSVFAVFILCGSRGEVEALLRQSPALAGAFGGQEWLEVLPPSTGEQMHLVQYYLKETPFVLDAAAEHTLAVQLEACWQQTKAWRQKDVERFVSVGIVERLKARLQAAYRPGQAVERRELVTVRPADIDLEGYLRTVEEVVPADAFAQSMQELDALVGLSALKESLRTTFLHTRFEQERQRQGLPAGNGGCHHMIFTGNPGTGKSTVAALIGKVYHSMGLLSKGEDIQTERGKLVGRYIGETEEKVNKVLEQARGNVLFIDEAYALCDTADDRKDFGNRVVESLLTVLTQPQADMLVILAGYADEMDRMMQMNPGLESRFPHRFHFDDYTAGELLQIVHGLLQRQQYVCTPEAGRALEEVVRRAVAGKDRHFGNARWAVQLVTAGILPALACRVMQGGLPLDRETLCTITGEDVERAAAKCSPRSQLFLAPRRRIGFTA